MPLEQDEWEGFNPPWATTQESVRIFGHFCIADPGDSTPVLHLFPQQPLPLAMGAHIFPSSNLIRDWLIQIDRLRQAA